MWWGGETGSLWTNAAGSAWPWSHRDTPSLRDLQQLVSAGVLWKFVLSLSLLLWPTDWQWVPDCRCSVSWHHCTASLFLAEISGNLLLDILFRFNQYSNCDAHCWPFLSKQGTLCLSIWNWGHSLKISAGSLDTMTKAEDFDRQILTQAKSPALSGHGVS